VVRQRIESVLTPRDRLLLTFEDTYPKPGGTKDERIRQTFGFSAVRYYQQLNALAGRQDAEEEFPLLVHRLRRLSVERARRRSKRAA
jgi:hypothetical protein